MNDVLTKVQRLIALTASDSKEEARTAAYQACKLIREHELTVVANGSAHPNPSADHVRRTYSSGMTNDEFSRLWADLFASSTPFAGVNRPRRPAPKRESDKWYPGKWPPRRPYNCSQPNDCHRCDERIKRGDVVCGVGPYVFHADCYPNRG